MLVTFSSATTALRCVTGLLVVFVTVIIILALLTMVPMVPDRSYAEVFVTSPSQQPPPLTLRTANAFSQAVDDFIQHFTVRTKHLHPPSTVAANKMKHDSKHQAALSKQKLADSKKNPHVSHGDMETLARKLDGFANPPSTTTPTTPTPPTPPTPPTGGGSTQLPVSVIPTPWSGGTARLSATDNHRILMDGKPLGVARHTRGPQIEKVIYDLNGAVNARLMLRKNRQLTLSFAPIVSKLNGRGTTLTSHQADRTPGTVIVGLTRPTKSQYRAYQSGFVQRAAHSFVSGRVQR